MLLRDHEWEVAIDNHDTVALQYQQSPFIMTALRTALRNETSDNIEYGVAILTALRLKAQRQLELVAPDQDENLLVLCRLILDIQAVQEKISLERYRLTTVR